jgi:hypothetical protein
MIIDILWRVLVDGSSSRYTRFVDCAVNECLHDIFYVCSIIIRIVASRGSADDCSRRMSAELKSSQSEGKLIAAAELSLIQRARAVEGLATT